jgi:hypothetical protein
LEVFLGIEDLMEEFKHQLTIKLTFFQKYYTNRRKIHFYQGRSLKSTQQANRSARCFRTATMEPAEMYKGWIIQSQKVFYVEAWDANGNRHVAVQNAKTEEEALELAKKWIDKYESKSVRTPMDEPRPFGDMIDMPF